MVVGPFDHRAGLGVIGFGFIEVDATRGEGAGPLVNLFSSHGIRSHRGTGNSPCGGWWLVVGMLWRVGCEKFQEPPPQRFARAEAPEHDVS